MQPAILRPAIMAWLVIMAWVVEPNALGAQDGGWPEWVPRESSAWVFVGLDNASDSAFYAPATIQEVWAYPGRVSFVERHGSFYFQRQVECGHGERQHRFRATNFFLPESPNLPIDADTLALPWMVSSIADSVGQAIFDAICQGVKPSRWLPIAAADYYMDLESVRVAGNGSVQVWIRKADERTVSGINVSEYSLMLMQFRCAEAEYRIVRSIEYRDGENISTAEGHTSFEAVPPGSLAEGMHQTACRLAGGAGE